MAWIRIRLDHRHQGRKRLASAYSLLLVAKSFIYVLDTARRRQTPLMLDKPLAANPRWMKCLRITRSGPLELVQRFLPDKYRLECSYASGRDSFGRTLCRVLWVMFEVKGVQEKVLLALVKFHVFTSTHHRAPG